MKKCKSKILTLLLSSALGGAAFFGALAFTPGIDASAADTYSPTSIFKSDGGTITAEGTEMKFVLNESGSVSFKRDLALKWYKEAGKPTYFSMAFRLEDINFSKLNITFETASAVALKENKATNKIVFENKDGSVFVKVNPSDEDAEDSDSGTELTAPTDSSIILSLTETDADGEPAKEGQFFVSMKVGDGEAAIVGAFENVGANFAEYSSGTTPMIPISFAAEFPEDAETKSSTLLFTELNGQSFVLESGMVKDNAEPVLVVNDEVRSFALGMPFALDYEVIDVCKTSVTKKLTYYQYNPTDFASDETTEEGEESDVTYSDLSTSTYFFDTVYTDADGKTESVYNTLGTEFVSIKFKLSDEVFTGDTAAEYELAWYASTAKTLEGDGTERLYIPIERNSEGPKYVTENFEALVENYQELVTQKAEDVYAGSNSYIYLPSLKGLIEDDDTGYKSLKFSIYYKTQTSDNATSSTSLSYDNLKIAVTSAGLYEFKIIATDKVGNSMYYDLDGERTKVTADTIWEIEEIPSFVFEIGNNGLSVEEDSDTVSGYKDVSCNVSDFTLVGLSDYSSEYALYYFDTVAFQRQYGVEFSRTGLADVKFEELKDGAAADPDFYGYGDDEYIDYFAKLYVKLLGERYGVKNISVEDLMNENEDGEIIFRRIEEYDSTINEDKYPKEWAESDNRYHWDSSARSFKPQESGAYIVLGVFTDSHLYGEKAAAYKAVYVEAEQDIIKGETQWLKNNLASIILFSVAGVLLILIIVLLLVKPSDETLEDVDSDKKPKKSKKAKADKK